jgi:pyruvate dehydrogenase E1 component alpha subunit
MSDPVSGTYRSKEEVEERTEQDDPITILVHRLFQAEALTQEDLEAMDGEVRAQVADAVAFADEAPLPEASELYKHVYSQINEHGRLFFDGRDR